MNSPKSNNWNELVNLIQELDGNKYSERALDILVEIESRVKKAGIRVDEALNNSDIDIIIRATLNQIAAKTSLSINEIIEQGKGTIDDILDFISESINGLKVKKTNINQLFETLGVKILKLKSQIVSTDPKEIEKGSGAGFEKPELEVSKIALLIGFLRDNEIYSDDILAIVGENNKNTMHQSSYVIFEIPRIQKAIVICEDYGEATFIVDLNSNYARGAIIKATKDELVNNYGAVRIIFNQNSVEKWVTELTKALFEDQTDEESQVIKTRSGKVNINEYAEKSFKMDKEYFSNPEKVKADLVAYTEKAMKVSPLELSIGYNEEVVCSNGESIKFDTYLKRAGKAIFSFDRTEFGSNKAKIRDVLLKIAGYEVVKYPEMDEEYFKNPVIVKADLVTFAEKAMKASPLELTTRFDEEVVCSNGEHLKFETYLKRAGKAIFSFDYIEIGKHLARTRDKLLRIAGYEIAEVILYPEMDEEYFKNPVIVKADLVTFAEKAMKASPLELTTGFDGEVICSNGESVKYNTYLYRAGKALFNFSNNESSYNLSSIRDQLSRIAGYEIAEVILYPKMNEEYFKNIENLKADLLAFTEGANLESPLKLRVKSNGAVLCCNGEHVIFNTYLKRAGNALFSMHDCESSKQLARIRDELLIIAGYEVVKYREMDEEYFKNPVIVKADLLAFAEAANFESPLELSTKFTNEALCSNGERVKFQTYLYRAGKRIFNYDHTELSKYKAKIRDKLLRLAGYEFEDKKFQIKISK